jgi:hypothetical protein
MLVRFVPIMNLLHLVVASFVLACPASILAATRAVTTLSDGPAGSLWYSINASANDDVIDFAPGRAGAVQEAGP